MNLSELLEEKRKNNLLLRGNYFSGSKAKPIGVVYISDKNLIKNLIKGLEVLPANFIIISDENIKTNSKNIITLKKLAKDMEIGLDFIVADNNMDNLKGFFHNGICPIVSSKSYLRAVLEEFNPIKVSGNAFIYKELNEWEIFYSIVRYLENYKFPYDNRNLIKNLLEIY